MTLFDPKGIEFEFVGGPFDGAKDRRTFLPDYIFAPPVDSDKSGEPAVYRLEKNPPKYRFVPAPPSTT